MAESHDPSLSTGLRGRPTWMPHRTISLLWGILCGCGSALGIGSRRNRSVVRVHGIANVVRRAGTGRYHRGHGIEILSRVGLINPLHGLECRRGAAGKWMIDEIGGQVVGDLDL